MRLKKIELFIKYCLLLVLVVSCDFSNKSKSEQLNAQEILAELNDLLLQLHQIDNTDCKNLDEIVTINENMRRMVENVQTTEKFEGLINAFDKKTHQIGFIFSEDEQFAVFSWRTKMDCLGNNIKNIALFKHNGTLKASSLYGNPMVYQYIKSHKMNDNKRVYILAGSSSTDKGSNDLTQRGYTISNGYLAELQIPEIEQAYVDNASR